MMPLPSICHALSPASRRGFFAAQAAGSGLKADVLPLWQRGAEGGVAMALSSKLTTQVDFSSWKMYI